MFVNTPLRALATFGVIPQNEVKKDQTDVKGQSEESLKKVNKQGFILKDKTAVYKDQQMKEKESVTLSLGTEVTVISKSKQAAKIKFENHTYFIDKSTVATEVK